MSAPYMQLYVADYLGDTQHLTAEQHGAYLLLLMAMWRHGGSLPNDPAILARIARVHPPHWKRVAAILMPFFEATEGGRLTQKRLLLEHQKASQKSQSRASAGALGGRAKALKNKKPDVAKATVLPQHLLEPDIRDNVSPSGKHSASARAKAPADELAAVLDGDHAKAVVDHRSRLRKPLTAHAAKLLAGKFARCPDPNAAADAMIANGWQGFDPDWLRPGGGRGPPAPRRDSMAVVHDFLRSRNDRPSNGQEHPDSIDNWPPGDTAALFGSRRVAVVGSGD